MVHRALAKSNLVFGTKQTLCEKKLKIAPDAGLLFPSSDSVELGELATDQRPSQLIVIDGTWSQANSLVRALPQLQSLPCYKLAPTQPGQYRIRLEPTDTSLSTVEATVAALKSLEPETENLDQLLVAFELMIQKQLDHPEVGDQHYSGGPIDGSTFNVPGDLYCDPTQIVVVYGEANFREPTEPKNVERTPVFWCAENLGTGERFFTALSATTPSKPMAPLPDTFLKHLELSREDFDQALTMDDFVERWNEFCKSAEVLVAYNEGTFRLLSKANQMASELAGSDRQANEGTLKTIAVATPKCLTLKSINFKAGVSLESENSSSLGGLTDPQPSRDRSSDPIPGRAGARLANIVSIVRNLHQRRAKVG